MVSYRRNRGIEHSYELGLIFLRGGMNYIGFGLPENF